MASSNVFDGKMGSKYGMGPGLVHELEGAIACGSQGNAPEGEGNKQ